MSQLPDELVREILLKLPSLKSALRLSCVCKLWHEWIIDHDFGDKLYNHVLRCGTKNDDPFMVFCREGFDQYQIQTLNSHHFGRITFCDDIICLREIRSCNGIIHFVDRDNRIHLYNPITREHRKLPPYGFSGDTYIPCFGFDAANNDYKVIIIHMGNQLVEIYRFSTNCWSKQDVDLRSIFSGLSFCSMSIYVNGCSYWMMLEQHQSPGVNIATFDFRTEKFGLIHFSVENPSPCHLAELDNSVAVCFSNPWENVTQVWGMSKYGNSWTKKFSINSARNGASWVHDSHVFQLKARRRQLITLQIKEEEGESHNGRNNRIFRFDDLSNHLIAFKPSWASLRSGRFMPASK